MLVAQRLRKGFERATFEAAAREKNRIEVCIFPTIRIFFPMLTRGMAHLRWNLVKQNECLQKRRDEVATGMTRTPNPVLLPSSPWARRCSELFLSSLCSMYFLCICSQSLQSLSEPTRLYVYLSYVM